MQKTTVVMPAYNEADRISEVIRPLVASGFEVLVVDDGSTDGTSEAAARAGATSYRHALNRGQGAALKTGTRAAIEAGAETIVHMDADGQHAPESIAALIAPIQDGKADVVFGSRFLGAAPEGMPFGRKMLLGAARQFSMLALGIPSTITDPQSGLRAMTAEAAEAIDFSQDRMAHCSEILRLVSRAPLRAMEVPVKVRYTDATLAKGQNAFDAARIVWQLLLGAFQR